jgi:hypothetical protein
VKHACIAIPWLLLILLCTDGCNVLGVAANAVAGGGSTSAAFTMAKHPTIILAEKYSNPFENRGDEEPLCRFIADEFAAHDIAPVIDPGKVYALRNDNPAQWRSMTIAAAGRAAGAEQILYVNIVSLSVDVASGSEMLRGRGDLRVRLVDAQTGATIWPTDAEEGYPVSAETRMSRAGQDGLGASDTRSELLRALAANTAKLFYVVKSD